MDAPQKKKLLVENLHIAKAALEEAAGCEFGARWATIPEVASLAAALTTHDALAGVTDELASLLYMLREENPHPGWQDSPLVDALNKIADRTGA